MAGFFLDWLNHVQVHSGRDLFAVGEYWSGESAGELGNHTIFGA
jgi:hypothetical protein